MFHSISELNSKLVIYTVDDKRETYDNLADYWKERLYGKRT